MAALFAVVTAVKPNEAPKPSSVVTLKTIKPATTGAAGTVVKK